MLEMLLGDSGIGEFVVMKLLPLVRGSEAICHHFIWNYNFIF